MPMCHLEVVGYPRLEYFLDKPVVILSVTVNINQKSLTIEEVLSQRKNMIEALGQNVGKEIEFDLQLVSNDPYSIDEATDVEKCLKDVSGDDPAWFNSDTNFLEILQRILKVKEDTIVKCVRQRCDGLEPQVFMFVCVTSCKINFWLLLPPIKSISCPIKVNLNCEPCDIAGTHKLFV